MFSRFPIFVGMCFGGSWVKKFRKLPDALLDPEVLHSGFGMNFPVWSGEFLEICRRTSPAGFLQWSFCYANFQPCFSRVSAPPPPPKKFTPAKGAKGLLDFQGRRGIASIVWWNLRLVICGVNSWGVQGEDDTRSMFMFEMFVLKVMPLRLCHRELVPKSSVLLFVYSSGSCLKHLENIMPVTSRIVSQSHSEWSQAAREMPLTQCWGKFCRPIMAKQVAAQWGRGTFQEWKQIDPVQL